MISFSDLLSTKFIFNGGVDRYLVEVFVASFICSLANIELCFSQNHRAMVKSEKNTSLISYQREKKQLNL